MIDYAYNSKTYKYPFSNYFYATKKHGILIVLRIDHGLVTGDEMGGGVLLLLLVLVVDGVQA